MKFLVGLRTFNLKISEKSVHIGIYLMISAMCISHMGLVFGLFFARRWCGPGELLSPLFALSCNCELHAKCHARGRHLRWCLLADKVGVRISRASRARNFTQNSPRNLPSWPSPAYENLEFFETSSRKIPNADLGWTSLLVQLVRQHGETMLYLVCHNEIVVRLLWLCFSTHWCPPKPAQIRHF